MKYFQITCILTIIAFLLFSCNKAKQGDLWEIPVDIDQNTSIPLSEIAEEITAIELELTNESMINPNQILRIFIIEEEVIVITWTKILVFNKGGKFIRSIGSLGQGPGEYINISGAAIDLKNKRLFVLSYPNFLIYDINGKFLKHCKSSELLSRLTLKNDLNFINDNLFIIGDMYTPGYREKGKDVAISSIVYQLDNDFHISDSCLIRTIILENLCSSTTSLIGYILNGSKNIYVYYGDFYISEKRGNLGDRQLCDTLYRFENNCLVPELKLKYKNNSKAKSTYLLNIYRSSRYIFAYYFKGDPLKDHYFCYDTKTNKGYNAQDGYSDDINKLKEPVRIRPLSTNTEMFYYLHTNMKPDDREEPNPTLYIGRLKK